MTELTKIDENTTVANPSPIEINDPVLRMIDKVVDGEHDIKTLKELLALRREEQDRQARIDFDQALSAASRDMPVIQKRGEGRNNTYALWEDLNEKIKPVLTKHGFSLSFTSDVKPEYVTVTATLRRGGIEIQGCFDAPIESPQNKSGNNVMNGAQARGSAMSYGKRYATIGLLNISTVGEDDDAHATSDSAEMTAWRERIGEITTIEEADKARADIMSATDITNTERTTIGHVWAAKRRSLESANA